MVLQTENERQKINSRWKYTGRNILSVMVAYEVNIFILSVKYWQTVSVCRDVGVCGISNKYFSTLDKISTDYFHLQRRRCLWHFQ